MKVEKLEIRVMIRSLMEVLKIKVKILRRVSQMADPMEKPLLVAEIS
jgi:hypothetical protein